MSRTSSHGPTNPTAMAHHIEALWAKERGPDRPDSEWLAWNHEVNRALNAGHRMNLARRRLLEVRYGPSRPTRPRTTPRARQRERHRGVTRRTSSSSRTSSADPPGEPALSDEPEPPAHGRPCKAAWCDHIVYGPPQKKYCGTERCNQARAEERQRKHRNGDLTAQERDTRAAARRAGMIGSEAFAPPLEVIELDGVRREIGGHALSFQWKFGLADGDDPGELEALLNRPTCRCNGHHIDGGAVGCFKCGLPRSEVVSCC